jgi:hypothetical protein
VSFTRHLPFGARVAALSQRLFPLLLNGQAQARTAPQKVITIKKGTERLSLAPTHEIATAQLQLCLPRSLHPASSSRTPRLAKSLRMVPSVTEALVPPPPPAELARLHKEWIEDRPTATFLTQQAKIDREQRIFDETASRPRWISAPDLPSVMPDGKAVSSPDRPKLDEFYELPGEDGADACAEVVDSPSIYDTYTVSIFAPNGERDFKLATRHLAEEMAVFLCGNGRHP